MSSAESQCKPELSGASPHTVSVAPSGAGSAAASVGNETRHPTSGRQLLAGSSKYYTGMIIDPSSKVLHLLHDRHSHLIFFLQIPDLKITRQGDSWLIDFASPPPSTLTCPEVIISQADQRFTILPPKEWEPFKVKAFTKDKQSNSVCVRMLTADGLVAERFVEFDLHVSNNKSYG